MKITFESFNFNFNLKLKSRVANLIPEWIVFLPLINCRTPRGNMSNYKERIKKLEDVLNESEIDLEALRGVSFHGLPGDKYRPIVWRILLKLLPLKKELWPDLLTRKRALYDQYLEDTLKIKQTDDPLNPNSATWSDYYKDNEVLLQIDKDVRRLYPEMSFFQSPTKCPNLLIEEKSIERLHTRVDSHVDSAVVERRGLGFSKLSKKGIANDEIPAIGEKNWEVVERILFVYAKLNPGQGYVQGMNEIVGPIYFTLASDSEFEWAQHAEADTFFLFTGLMGEIRDFFIRSLDNSKSGIQERLKQLMERLSTLDKPVYDKLMQDGIHPQFFSFRWITLLLSQEFPLPEVQLIWDCLFSDRDRFNFLNEFCVAMIIKIRDQILLGDFTSNMKLLQNFPHSIDVRDIIRIAQQMNK